MQEHLQEIEGTLARTAQRKQTIISNLHKRQREQEILSKLGVSRLPTNPAEADNLELIKYKVNLLKQNIGEQIAIIRNPNKFSIAKDGEAVIRSRNDEINRLSLEKYRWEMRLFNLSSKTKANEPEYPSKAFFGCAKELPEAFKSDGHKESKITRNVYDLASMQDTMTKSEDEIYQGQYENEPSDLDINDDNSYDNSLGLYDYENVFHNNNAEVQRINFHNSAYKKCINELCKDDYKLSTDEKRLMIIEQSREKELRRINLLNSGSTRSFVSKTIKNLMSIEHNLPSEDDIRRRLVEARKQQLLCRFEKLRNLDKERRHYELELNINENSN